MLSDVCGRKVVCNTGFLVTECACLELCATHHLCGCWYNMFFKISELTKTVLCVSARVGVSSEPDHSVVELTEQDRFIILASDGVWEFITSKEAVEIVSQCESAEEACRQVGVKSIICLSFYLSTYRSIDLFINLFI